jgi:hypothetical protein
LQLSERDELQRRLLASSYLPCEISRVDISAPTKVLQPIVPVGWRTEEGDRTLSPRCARSSGSTYGALAPVAAPLRPVSQVGGYVRLAGSYRGWRGTSGAARCPEVADANVLPAEESPLELPKLGRRKPRRRECLHDFIRDLPLFWRQHRRVAAPAQTGANVRVHPRALARELIGESMQVLHLLEQRLKLVVGNRHDLPRVRLRQGKSFAHPTLVARETRALRTSASSS